MYCDKFLMVGRDNSMTTLAAYVLESGVKAKFSFRYPKCLNDSIPLKLNHGAIIKETMNDVTEITKLIKKEGIKTICFQSNFISYNNNLTIARMLRREFGDKIILVQGGQFFSEYKPAPNLWDYILFGNFGEEDFRRLCVNIIANKEVEELGEAILRDGTRITKKHRINPAWVNKRYKYEFCSYFKNIVFETYLNHPCPNKCKFCGWKTMYLPDYTFDMCKQDFLNTNKHIKFDVIDFTATTATNQLNLELINSLSSKDMKQPLSISGDLSMEEKPISHFFENVNWDVIKELGLSFGLQSFNDKALKAVGRYSLFDVAKAVTDKYRAHEKIKLDCCMIVGFPGQTIEDFKEDVKTVVRELKIRPFPLHLICITNYLIENYRFDRYFQILESDCITEEELKTFIDVTDPLMNKCMETCKDKCDIEKCVYLNSHW